ncbi:MAG: hypothetical protein HGA45_21900 [Chloroflexales bacterium]|nr:hypothetical protein [Chloroflexales bacterium]
MMPHGPRRYPAASSARSSRFYHRLLKEHFAAHREPGQPWVPVMGEEGT